MFVYNNTYKTCTPYYTRVSSYYRRCMYVTVYVVSYVCIYTRQLLPTLCVHRPLHLSSKQLNVDVNNKTSSTTENVMM